MSLMRPSGTPARRRQIGVVIVSALLGFSVPVWGWAADAVSVTGCIEVEGLRSSAGVVVSLEQPGLEVSAPAEPVQMDQKGLRFIPHVLPVVVGTTVRFLNNDPEPHNVYSPEGRYNLGTWPQGEVRDYRFTRTGEYTQLCRIHPEMEAFVVAVRTPYFATTSDDGHFEIPGVPPGEYTLVVWSERRGRHEEPLSVSSGATASVDVKLTR